MFLAVRHSRAGLVWVGDELVAIGQGETEPNAIDSMTIAQVVALTKGVFGSRIQLLFRPKLGLDASDRVRVTLVRRRVTAAALIAAGVVSCPGATVGVVRVPTFYGKLPDGGTASSHLGQALEQLQTRGVAGIVPDLRGNTGGYFTEVTECAGLFLGDNLVAQLRHYDGSLQQDKRARALHREGGHPLIT